MRNFSQLQLWSLRGSLGTYGLIQKLCLKNFLVQYKPAQPERYIMYFLTRLLKLMKKKNILKQKTYQFKKDIHSGYTRECCKIYKTLPQKLPFIATKKGPLNYM